MLTDSTPLACSAAESLSDAVQPMGDVCRDPIQVWNARARRISPCELRALVGLAAESGIDSDALMNGTQLQFDGLERHQTRVSFHEQLALQRRASELGLDPCWPVQVGRRMHLTSYGLVGYAMLSAKTLATSLTIAAAYKPLLNLKHDLRLVEVDAEAVLTLAGGFALERVDEVPCTVLELVKMVSLLRDLLGSSFHPTSVSLCGQLPSSLAIEMERYLGCQVVHGEQAQIRFPAAHLALSLLQSDAPTHRGCVQACEKAMTELLIVDETTTRVRAALEGAMPGVPSMAEVASDLCLSPRSLRRRLAAEGTSYNEILDFVRRRMSERLLADTAMTIESIAELLGYGDAANFRHAFKRWTGESPRSHRRSATVLPVRRAGTSWARAAHRGLASIAGSEMARFELA